MQRRPSKRLQHASQSPDTATQNVDAQQERNKETKETKSNFDFAAHVPTTICLVLVCILPFLAALALFVWFYYSFNYLGDDGNGSRLLQLLHDYESISSFSPSSSTLDIDDRIYGDGQLRPEDHIYRAALTQTLNWSITAEQRRPDGVNKNVYLINGRFYIECAQRQTIPLADTVRSFSRANNRSTLRRYTTDPRAQWPRK